MIGGFAAGFESGIWIIGPGCLFRSFLDEVVLPEKKSRECCPSER